MTALKFENRCGPAGILSEELISGTPAVLFISADKKNAERVSREWGTPLVFLTETELAVMILPESPLAAADAMEILKNPEVIIGTSTPGDDPGGDYAEIFKEKLRKKYPSWGEKFLLRCKALVGGKNSEKAPKGVNAVIWNLEKGAASAFLGYAHASRRICDPIRLVPHELPKDLSVRASYWFTYKPSAQAFADFLRSDKARRILLEEGFLEN